MRWGEAAALVLTALALGTAPRAEVLDPSVATASPPAEAQPLPPVSARAPNAAPPEPTLALDLLPPGIRPRTDRSVAWTRPGGDPSRPDDPGQLIEVIRNPAPQLSAADWLEVEYTVDPELDERVRGMLRRRGVPLGHVIVMDPDSGEVFSYVSTDPANFPATRTYPTASLMKVVTAAALLRHAPDAVSRDCRYVGSPYSLRSTRLVPPRSGGRVDSFERALAISNNQCFARFAVNDLGEDALLEEIGQVGLLEPPAVRHPAGRVEPIQAPLDLGNLGSGLAGSYVTPLGAARLAALLAQGQLVRPFWIARVRDSRGTPLRIEGRETARPVWSPRTAEELRALMVSVTERGTARSAFRGEGGSPLLGDIHVSGKTGSLSGTDPEGLYTWFIGVAPADAPRVAIATVVVHDPGVRASASEVAAATLREVFCDESGADCAAVRADRLHARRALREAELEEELREAELALDEAPRPLDARGFRFPRRLRRHPVEGRIVLLVDLTPEGEVVDVRVDSSDLPEFEEYVVEEVRSWRFTPPLRRGRPVEATARLPIPIRVR